MKNKRILSLVLAAAILLTGCNSGKAVTTEKSDITEVTETTETSAISESAQTENKVTEPFEFNPHVYSGKVAERIPQDYWDALYNLCDALRKGETTFKCANQDAYWWATDTAVLCCYMPIAGGKLERGGKDDLDTYENGVGKFRLNMPMEDFLKRQADFEALIVDILNSTVEKDDTDYEKALKLYLYIANNYKYTTEVDENENYVYKAFTKKTGMCVNFAAIYAYLLLQVGVDAVNVGIYEEDMCHAWTIVTINGKSYHVDTTWALKSDENPYISLDYFLMSDEERINEGCLVRNLSVSVFPEEWANETSVSFAANDTSYLLRPYCRFISLDEEQKIVHYLDVEDKPQEFRYDI